MARNRIGRCCGNYQFQFLAHASKVDGVEFTLGKCTSCDAHVIDCYAPYGADRSKYNQPIVVSEDVAKSIQSFTDGAQLRDFMDNWFNDDQ